MTDLKDTQVTRSAPRNDSAPAFPRENSKSVLESPRVLVWDATWRPDHEIVPQLHGTDTVVVFLEGGTIRVRSEDGTEETSNYSYKDIAFLPGGTVHTTKVERASPRAKIYELKDQQQE